jgi:hypothetical protein
MTTRVLMLVVAGAGIACALIIYVHPLLGLMAICPVVGAMRRASKKLSQYR